MLSKYHMLLLYKSPKLSSEYYVVSMTILDDLEHYDSFPKHIIVEKMDITTLFSAVRKLIKSYSGYGGGLDPLYMFNKPGTLFNIGYYYYENDNFIDEICACLINDNYYVLNRIEKYYVLAFSINYTQFEVYSKDCDKKFIDWKYDADTTDNIKVTGIIDDPDYNLNPLIKMIRSIHQNYQNY